MSAADFASMSADAPGDPIQMGDVPAQEEEQEGDENEIEPNEDDSMQDATGGAGGALDDSSDEDDDDDDIQIKIGEVRTNVPFQALQKGVGAGSQSTGKALDVDTTAEIAGTVIYDVDLAEMNDKPWRKPGADITDYFNYGFTEDTWNMYCERQRKLRHEYGTQALANKALFSSISLSSAPGGGVQGNNMPHIPTIGSSSSNTVQRVTVLGGQSQQQQELPKVISLNLAQKYAGGGGNVQHGHAGMDQPTNTSQPPPTNAAPAVIRTVITGQPQGPPPPLANQQTSGASASTTSSISVLGGGTPNMMQPPPLADPPGTPTSTSVDESTGIEPSVQQSPSSQSTATRVVESVVNLPAPAPAHISVVSTATTPTSTAPPVSLPNNVPQQQQQQQQPQQQQQQQQPSSIGGPITAPGTTAVTSMPNMALPPPGAPMAMRYTGPPPLQIPINPSGPPPHMQQQHHPGMPLTNMPPPRFHGGPGGPTMPPGVGGPPMPGYQQMPYGMQPPMSRPPPVQYNRFGAPGVMPAGVSAPPGTFNPAANHGVAGRHDDNDRSPASYSDYSSGGEDDDRGGTANYSGQSPVDQRSSGYRGRGGRGAGRYDERRPRSPYIPRGRTYKPDPDAQSSSDRRRKRSRTRSRSPVRSSRRSSKKDEEKRSSKRSRRDEDKEDEGGSSSKKSSSRSSRSKKDKEVKREVDADNSD